MQVREKRRLLALKKHQRRRREKQALQRRLNKQTEYHNDHRFKIVTSVDKDGKTKREFKATEVVDLYDDHQKIVRQRVLRRNERIRAASAAARRRRELELELSDEELIALPF